MQGVGINRSPPIYCAYPHAHLRIVHECGQRTYANTRHIRALGVPVMKLRDAVRIRANATSPLRQAVAQDARAGCAHVRRPHSRVLTSPRRFAPLSAGRSRSWLRAGKAPENAAGRGAASRIGWLRGEFVLSSLLQRSTLQFLRPPNKKTPHPVGPRECRRLEACTRQCSAGRDGSGCTRSRSRSGPSGRRWGRTAVRCACRRTPAARGNG